MAEKKKMSSEYYETRTAMQELLKDQKNVEMFLDEEQKREDNLLLLLFQHIKNSGDYIFRCFQQSFVIMSRVL